ncbi:MAG: hypothetical protein ACXVCI_02210 [Bdellovibrionota bacterium]
MMKFIPLFLFVSVSARAEVVCNVKTSIGPAQVHIGDSSATITGEAIRSPRVYPRIDITYDGHETSLITAPGLSITYKNAFGYIRMAKITADFRGLTDNGLALFETVETGTCSGGSTPDSICKPTN